MVKKIKLLLTALCLSAIFIPKVCFADEVYKNWTPAQNVSVNKIWKITLTKEFDTDTLDNNIYIKDENNNNFNVIIIPENNNKTLSIVPASDYDYGKKYSLIITSNVKSKEEKSIGHAIKMDFTTENNYVDPSSQDVDLGDEGTTGSDPY